MCQRVLVGLPFAVILLPFVTLFAYAVPDSTQQDNLTPENISSGQIIALTVSVGVAITGLWLYFRKPKRKQAKIKKTAVMSQRLVNH
jgi:uncharacterized membrane protein affecting hemolysin expression